MAPNSASIFIFPLGSVSVYGTLGYNGYILEVTVVFDQTIVVLD